MQNLIKEIPTRLRVNEIDKEKLFTKENLTKIDRDFVIYRFEFQTEDMYYSPFIDQIYKTIKPVKAIVNGYRNKNDGKGFFYVLFENTGNSEFTIKEQLDEIIPKGELTRQKVKVNTTKQATTKDKDGIPERYLAQLLINSLAHTCKDGFDNMTGKLYWLVRPEKGTKKNLKEGLPNIAQYVALEILISKDLLLELNVRTFTNIEYVKKFNVLGDKINTLHKREHFIIRSDDKKSTMQPSVKNGKNKEEDIFIIAQFKGKSLKKSVVPFFNFSTGNTKSFKESKSGILYRLLEQSQKYLSEYMTIQFCKYPFTKSINEKSNSTTNNNLVQFFKQKQINIDVADSLKDDETASKLKKEIKDILKKQYEFENVNIAASKIDAINFRIIQNEKHYKKEEIKITDEHFSKLEVKNKDKYVVQHLTIDDFKNANKSKVNYLLTEAFIKNDLKQKKISIIDWKYGEWTFLQRREKEAEDKKQDNIIEFFLMTIKENGELDFEVCKGHNLFSSKEHQEYQRIYVEKYQNTKGKYETRNIEGLVISSEGDINIIYRTDIITIQEIEEIALEFRQAEKDTKIQISDLIKMFSNFLMQQKTKEYKEVIVSICEDAKEFGETITKTILNDLFKKYLLEYKLIKEENGINKNSLKQKFNYFYKDNSLKYLGIEDVLHPRIIKQEINESQIGIQYYQDNDEGYYFAGEYYDKIQYSSSTATHIRKIKPVNKLNGQKSEILFEQLLPTMNVDFVKKGNPTVIPFPFKYLREWIKINEHSL